MKRLVLDTDVIIAGMRSPTGASAALLLMALENQFEMLASVPLFFEYEAKCTSPIHWTEAGLNKEQANIFVAGLAALIKPVKTHYLWRPLLRDPNDEMVLEVAVNGAADSIVTFNFRDYGNIPDKFGVQLLKPAQALRSLKDD